MSKSIAEIYKKTTSNKYSFLLSEQKKFKINDWIDTGNYMLNSLFSADPNKGIPAGKVVQLAGPSSVGKTFITLNIIRQAQKKGYTVLYYDTEAGLDPENLEEDGINPELFIYSPVNRVKEVQTDLLQLIENLEKDQKLFVVIDSLGNLTSNKEYEDSRSGKSAVDMTRAKEIKSLFRTITLPAAQKNIPIIIVNHEYSTTELYSKKVQSGGSGAQYNSSIIISMSKSKEKEKDGRIIGSGVRCTSVKNRFARELLVARVVINYSSGISKYSGLFDEAIEGKFIISPKKGWFQIKDTEKLLRKKDIFNNEILWEDLLKNGFADYLRNKFAYKSHSEEIIDDSEIEEDEEIFEE